MGAFHYLYGLVKRSDCGLEWEWIFHKYGQFTQRFRQLDPKCE